MDKLKERGENMNDVRELIPQLDLISVERTSLVPVRMDPRPLSKRRDLAALGLEITAGVSIALNVVFAVIIYVLQAGPI